MCEACSLHQKYGDSFEGLRFVSADLRLGKPLIVGESPGDSEVTQRLGFVGRAGQWLWTILGAMGMTREDFSVTNVLKCQPPGNKFALGGMKAARACSVALRHELDLSRPAFVIALGKEAMQALTGTKLGITELRGTKLRLRDSEVPVYPLFHPSYLLRTRDPKLEEQFVDDLIRIFEGKHGRKEPRKVHWALVPGHTAAANISFKAAVVDTESYLDGSLRCIGTAGSEDVYIWEKGIIPALHTASCLIFHFARHDYCLLRRLGVIPESWRGEIRDTILMTQLLDENRPSYSLKTWAEEKGYGHYWKDVHAAWERKEDPDRSLLLPYCATDVQLTRDLYEESNRELDRHPRLRRLHDSVLAPALRLLAECELNGIQISPRVVEGKQRIQKRLRYHRKQILRVLDSMGIEAPKNLNGRLFKEQIFFEKLRLFSGYTTSITKKPAMHKRAMAEMERLDSTGIVKSYRQLSKYQTQRGLLKQLLPHAGSLIHPKFNLGGKGRKNVEKGSPVTGRLSAQDPNTQQFPPWMRGYVVSRFPKGVILKWDAKQLEMRVAYEYSRDPALIEGDTHQITADWVSAAFKPFNRAQGKTANFAVIFGAEEEKLTQEFGLSEGEAKALRRALRDRFPIHFAKIEEWKHQLRETGEIESLCGRVRRLPLAKGRRANHHAINQGINFPIQCFANTLNLLCALHLGPHPRGGLLVNLVHDEGDLDMDSRSGAIRLGKQIQNYWRNHLLEDVKKLLGVELAAPYDVDILIGPSWGEMEQVA